MLVINATNEQIKQALAEVNKRYDGNIVFKRLDPAGLTRQKEQKHTVTLTVKSSFEPGARRTPTGRRLAAACWHAHGYFFDALPENSRIQINFWGKEDRRPGQSWIDYTIRGGGYQVRASEACDCRELGLE